VYNPATNMPNMAEVIIAKHRNGPIGKVALWFEKRLTKFMDADIQHQSLVDLE
jgi:replicative DNA helicase